jgi:hypothetical protein
VVLAEKNGEKYALKTISKKKFVEELYENLYNSEV